MSMRADSVSQSDLGQLCELIYSECGIKLSLDKQVMIEGRLKRRLRELDIETYAEYCRFLFLSIRSHKDRQEEIGHLIDVMTTNKTDFFRESAHFDYLVDKALPELAERLAGRQFTIWSAGCSTGEEPYTMAIVLSEYALAHPGFRFRIFASDISNIVLEHFSIRCTL